MIRVNVAISTWNRDEELDKLLRSLYNQDYTHYDVYVIDNGSVDNTSSVLEKYTSLFGIDRFHYTILDKPHPNAMFTLNMAFKQSSGEYILVLDDDALLTQNDAISKLVEVLDAHKNCAIVGCNVRDWNNNVTMGIKDINFNASDYTDISNDDVFEYNDFCGACALFRRSMISQVGYYDESFVLYWNEPDIALKCVANGWNVLLHSKVIVNHGSMKGRKPCRGLYHAIKNGARVLNRNLQLRQRIFVVPLYCAAFTFMYIHGLRGQKGWYKYLLPFLFMDLVSCFQIFVYGKRNHYNSLFTHNKICRIYTQHIYKEILGLIA